jgi:hypothetical protein
MTTIKFKDDEMKHFQAQFNSFDKNGDGSIDVKELISILTDLGEPHDEAAVRQLVLEVDTNRSGTIEFNEFIEVIKGMRVGPAQGFARVYQKQEFINKNDALRFAAKTGNLKEIQEMIKKGADPTNTTSYGNTALHIAANEGKLEIVQYLLTCGKEVDPRAKTNRGETPLHYAAQWGQTEICKYLIESANCEKDLFLEDQVGYTPLDYAKYRGFPQTYEYLLNAATKSAKTNDVERLRVRFRRASLTEDEGSEK